MLDAMYYVPGYASTALCLFVRYFPVAGARMLAGRTSSRLLVIARIFFMHVCLLDARYVRRRVSHARAMPARYSCSHARPPSMNECTFTRCPLLNVVASMPIRRPISASVSTTKHVLLIFAYRCAYMLDTGRYHVYAAVVFRWGVPSPGRRSPSHA